MPATDRPNAGRAGADPSAAEPVVARASSSPPRSSAAASSTPPTLAGKPTVFWFWAPT